MLRKLASHPGSGSGLGKNLLQTAEYAVSSYGLGYIQNAFPGRAHIFGVPLNLAVGVGSKVASFGLTVAGALGGARPHLDVLGNAGIGAYFHALGSGHGFAKSGRVRALLPAASVDKLKKAVPEVTIFGVSQKAPQGDLLTAADLARLAR